MQNGKQVIRMLSRLLQASPIAHLAAPTPMNLLLGYRAKILIQGCSFTTLAAVGKD